MIKDIVSFAVYSVAQLCMTLCNPMNYSLPGSFVHGIFQQVCHFLFQGIFPKPGSKPALVSPALTGGFFSYPCSAWESLRVSLGLPFCYLFSAYYIYSVFIPPPPFRLFLVFYLHYYFINCTSLVLFLFFYCFS